MLMRQHSEEQRAHAVGPVHPQSIAHTASDALFGYAPLAETVWPAQRVSVAEATAVARQLFGEVHPHGPSAEKATVTPVRPFFPKSILRPAADRIPLGYTLGETVSNGWPLYLQGAAHGVGASFLALRYAEQFNRSAAAVGDARNAALVRILPKTRTLRHFFDALALGLRAPLTSSELRFRSSAYLAQRVLGAAAQRRTVCLVLDHVHYLEADGREVLAELINVLNPDQHLHDPETGARPFPRVGLILVSHERHDVLFRDQPNTATSLEGRVAHLPPYTTIEQVGEALELADIGVGRFDPEDEDDRAMAAKVLESTSGLAELMNPFFARMRMIARRKQVRPNAAVAHAVVPYQRRLVELRERLADEQPGGREYQVRVITSSRSRRPWLPAGSSDAEHQREAQRAVGRGAVRPLSPSGGERDPEVAGVVDDGDLWGDRTADGPGNGARGRRGKVNRARAVREEVLADKRRADDNADAVRRRMAKGGHTNL